MRNCWFDNDSRVLDKIWGLDLYPIEFVVVAKDGVYISEYISFEQLLKGWMGKGWFGSR